jgi:hypothetical protein
MKKSSRKQGFPKSKKRYFPDQLVPRMKFLLCQSIKTTIMTRTLLQLHFSTKARTTQNEMMKN